MDDTENNAKRNQGDAVDDAAATTPGDVGDAEEDDGDDFTSVCGEDEDFVMVPRWTEMTIDDNNISSSSGSSSSSSSDAASAKAACDRATTPVIGPRTEDARHPAADGHDAVQCHSANDKSQIKGSSSSSSSSHSNDEDVDDDNDSHEKNDSSSSSSSSSNKNEYEKNHDINGGNDTHTKSTSHNNDDDDDNDSDSDNDAVNTHKTTNTNTAAFQRIALPAAATNKPCHFPTANLASSAPDLLRYPQDTPPARRWDILLRTLSPASFPRETPTLPPFYFPRTQLLDNCIAHLTTYGVSCLGLFGPSGVGKTVLASAVIGSNKIREHFQRGVFWVGVGRVGLGSQRRLRGLLRSLAIDVVQQYFQHQKSSAAVAPASPAAVALLDAVTESRAATVQELLGLLAAINEGNNIGRHRRLVVLDDVWDPEIVLALRAAKCHLLVTSACGHGGYNNNSNNTASNSNSRKPRAVVGGLPGFGSRDVELVGNIVGDDAVRLLLGLQPWEGVEEGKAEEEETEKGGGGDGASSLQAVTPLALKIAEHFCGWCPLALSILGAVDALKARPIPTSDDDPESVWKTLYGQLEQLQDDKMTSFGRVVHLSFSELDLKSRECFRRLGVLAEGTVAPLDMLSHLWDQDAEETERILTKLLDRCLLQEVDQARRYYCVHSRVLAIAKRKLLDDGNESNESNDIIIDENNNNDGDSDGDGVVRAVTARQARYLGDLDILLRYASWHSVGGAGDLGSLAALWHSLEDISSFSRGAAGDVRCDGSTADSSPLLRRKTYGDALDGLGECARAATGYWAAATVLQLQNNCSAAKEMGKRSVCMGHALYKARASLAQKVAADTAIFNTQQGRQDDVMELHLDWVKSTKETLGPTHPAVGAALNSLAVVCIEQGKFGRAEGACREALAVVEDALGSDHPQVTLSLVNLAEVVMLKTDGPQKEPEALMVGVAICTRVYSIFDNIVESKKLQGAAPSLIRLAEMLDKQGEGEEAKWLARRALDIVRRENGRYDVQYGAILVFLGGLLMDTKNHEEAEKLYRKAVIAGERHVGPRHPKVAAWRSKLASSLTSQGKCVEAAAQLLPVLEHNPETSCSDTVEALVCVSAQLEELASQANLDELVCRMVAIEADRQQATIDSPDGGETMGRGSNKDNSEANSAEGGGAKRRRLEDDSKDNEEEEEEGGENGRQHLEAAVYHLYANHPRNNGLEAFEDTQEVEEHRLLQQAIRLSLREETEHH